MNSTDKLCINSLRFLSIDAIQKAQSGHPGLPMGAAPMAYVLWKDFLKHSPQNPEWANRDRFVLSAGHGSMLLYSLLHLTGYDLSMEEIQRFRQWGSLTPGHPEYRHCPGVECTTGPLGQGFANAVGMAIAERNLAHRFNQASYTLIDHHTYCLVGDGDLMEGISYEAASLAGHLQLGKLICLYDSNDISLDGPCHMTFTEEVSQRFKSQGWQVLLVSQGDDDLQSIEQALTLAQQEQSKPSLIIVKTTIGYGSPNKQGSSAVHGSPLGEEEVKLTRQKLQWKSAPFEIPQEALDIFRSAVGRGKSLYDQWQALFSRYEKEFPNLAREFKDSHAGKLAQGWDQWQASYKVGEKIPTRKASGNALNRLAEKIPQLIGGDADLSCSTNTLIQKGGDFEGRLGSGRNIRYGVREHAMAAIANGLAYHGGTIPFVATFFCFSDYMKPAVRLAALNGLHAIYVWTHDSVALGEDGPTHQPIEHLMALRALPNMLVLRPADAWETEEAWKVAVSHRGGPVGLVLSRQNLPVIDYVSLGSDYRQLHRGAYVLSAEKSPLQIILIATGSEVSLALQSQIELEKQKIGCRVVSMPSWELFAKESQSYRDSVLPPQIKKRLSIEAGSTLGWSRWTGSEGLNLGIDRFGASAPEAEIWKNLGFTVPHILQIAQEWSL